MTRLEHRRDSVRASDSDQPAAVGATRRLLSVAYRIRQTQLVVWSGFRRIHPQYVGTYALVKRPSVSTRG